MFDPSVAADDIETFIKNMKVKDQSIGGRYGDLKFLLNDCSVDFNVVRQGLHGDTTFKDKCLIWIPYDEYGGIDDINPETDELFKEGLVSHADILGSSNKKQADDSLILTVSLGFHCGDWKRPSRYYGWDVQVGWTRRALRTTCHGHTLGERLLDADARQRRRSL